MHILLISRCPPYPLHLGDRLIVYHLARELHARGHVIDLLAFSDRIDDFADRQHYAEFFREMLLLPEPPRFQSDYVRRLLGWQPRFASQPDQSWSPEMARQIEKFRSTHDYDVVHLFGGVQVYEYAPLLGDAPALITPYESYALYLRRMLDLAAHTRSPFRWIKTRLQLTIARGFERFMFAPYRATVVVSEPDRAELLRLNPALNVQVIPNGIDLNTFHVPESSTRPRELDTILFTGNYEYAPNVDAALRLIRQIVPRVRARIPGLKVWIVGHAPPESLKSLADDTITITGRVPDLRTYLARATVYVSPLRIGAGIKNKILEALAMGCPVAVTPLSVDGISVTDGESALIAPGDEDDDALAEAVIRLLKDATLRETLSLNGRQLIEQRYTWSQAAAAYESLYRTIAAQREERA
ncbi:MAG: glycosyltransferase family 4 protein [Anaerolineae bacterium]